MTIAGGSKKHDRSVGTMRYYERIGLIPPVPRMADMQASLERLNDKIKSYDQGLMTKEKLLQRLPQKGETKAGTCVDRSRSLYNSSRGLPRRTGLTASSGQGRPVHPVQDQQAAQKLTPAKGLGQDGGAEAAGEH